MNSKLEKFDSSVGSFSQALLPYLSDFDKKEIQFIESAFDFAKKMHADQKRISGEPYFFHPLSVAKNILQHQPDKETVAAALLHDVAEDCDVSIKDLSDKFGSEVASLVDGVTKISSINMKEKALGLEFSKNHFTSQIDSYRKLLTAIAGDPRVLIIKLYDRLHNAQTLEWLPKQRQRFYALETIEIFAALAERIGMSAIKSQLDDLCFPYAYPKEYDDFIKSITIAKTEREKYIKKIINILNKKLPGIEISGRAKHNLSIYNKLSEKQSIDNIYDLVAIRIIVPTISICYETLARVHELFKPIDQGVTDSILKPRDSGYQSLHTIVAGPDNIIFEIQIRTPHMHKVAEFGIAAHWYYKEKMLNKGSDKGASSWISELREGKAVRSKKHFFADKIFVFSPQGKIVELPKNTSPLDFAFFIHTEIGLSCFGAKVNGKMVPISSQLRTGDVVEIIKSDRVKPSRDWLSFVKTSFARSKINEYFTDLDRPKNYAAGLDIVNQELARLEKPIITEKNLKTLSTKISDSRLPFNDLETALVSVGKKDISKNDIIKTLYPNVNFAKAKIIKRASGKKIVHFEIGDGFTHRLANCCKPTEKDEIIGYITLQKVITVHRKNCRGTKTFDKERILEVSWR
ncbi:MAG: RelA/SpoT family protein [Candidatus Berkelbacteria bacterium]|nr:RelA/SpoT family protein [Candidatus Berkelbacteria bacterium]